MHYFGPPAAQNDVDLLSYFHVTRQAKSMIDFSMANPAFMYVARPGAGKTALRRWLAENSKNHMTIVITSEKTRLSSDDESLNSGDIRLIVEVELITAILSEVVKTKRGSEKARKKAKDFLSAGWDEVMGKFFKEKLGGLSILGCGFSLKPEDRKNYLKEIRQSDRLSSARKALKELTKELNILLVVDDPELVVGEGLDELTPNNARRVGALLSVLAIVHSLNARVIVLLRENILQNTREHYTDFQHFDGQIEGLEWTSQDLIELLNRRITTRMGTTWDRVFTVTSKTLEEKLFPYLVSGPRDLVTLSNLAGKDGGKIPMARYTNAFRSYRSKKWDDLHTYYSAQWPGIDRFAKALITALTEKYNDRNIPINGINEEFEAQFIDTDSEIHRLRTSEPWIDRLKWESPPVDERLFIMGCVGYIVAKQKYFPWAGRDLDGFRLASSHFLSKGFKT